MPNDRTPKYARISLGLQSINYLAYNVVAERAALLAVFSLTPQTTEVKHTPQGGRNDSISPFPNPCDQEIR